MSRIAEIRARLEAATCGPWPEDYVYDAVRHIARNCDHVESQTDPDFGWDRYSDAPLIAHAPQDIADLLAVVEAASEMYELMDGFAYMPYDRAVARLRNGSDG